MTIFGEVDRFLRVIGLQSQRQAKDAESFDITGLAIVCLAFVCTSLQMVWYFVIDAQAFSDRAEALVSFINTFSMSAIFAVLIWQRKQYFAFFDDLRSKIIERK